MHGIDWKLKTLKINLPYDIYISMCNRLRAKNSKEVFNGYDAVGPFDPIVASGRVKNLICFQRLLARKLKMAHIQVN